MCRTVRAVPWGVPNVVHTAYEPAGGAHQGGSCTHRKRDDSRQLAGMLILLVMYSGVRFLSRHYPVYRVDGERVPGHQRAAVATRRQAGVCCAPRPHAVAAVLLQWRRVWWSPQLPLVLSAARQRSTRCTQHQGWWLPGPGGSRRLAGDVATGGALLLQERLLQCSPIVPSGLHLNQCDGVHSKSV